MLDSPFASRCAKWPPNFSTNRNNRLKRYRLSKTNPLSPHRVKQFRFSPQTIAGQPDSSQEFDSNSEADQNTPDDSDTPK